MDDLLRSYEAFFTDERNGYYFPNEDSDGLLLEREKNFIARILDDSKDISESNLAMQRSFNTFNLLGHYALASAEDRERFLENFALSSLYGYYAILLTQETRKYFEDVALIEQLYLCEYIASLLLCSWQKEVEISIDMVIQELNKENARFLMDVQDNQYNVILYFILELYAKMKNIELDTGELKLPSFTYPYDKVIESYDTVDVNEVDKWVYILCERRLEFIKEDEKFQHITRQLFPYEILTWIKLREEQGLENPKEYSHSLMNTPIAKMFLEIKEPLPKPKELPYAKEILEKLKEKCPQIEITEES